MISNRDLVSWLLSGWGDWLLKTFMLGGISLFGMMGYVICGGEVTINLPLSVIEQAVERGIDEAVTRSVSHTKMAAQGARK